MLSCEVPPGIGRLWLAEAEGAMPSSAAPLQAATETPVQSVRWTNDGDHTTCPPPLALEAVGKEVPPPRKLPVGMAPKSGLGSAAASTIGARSSSRSMIDVASPKVPRPE